MAEHVEAFFAYKLEYQTAVKQNENPNSLRLRLDRDARFYREQGYPDKEALFGDTVVSFWTIYKQLLRLKTGLKKGSSAETFAYLLEQSRSPQEDEETLAIRALNETLEPLAAMIDTAGNFMLLPKRGMNPERYAVSEDRIDITLYECFSGGKLSHYFEHDDALRQWILKEHFECLFTDGIIEKENLIWGVNSRKMITGLDEQELYQYMDYAMQMIAYRNEACSGTAKER